MSNPTTIQTKIQTLINLLYYLASIFWMISVLIYVYKYNSGKWTSVEVLSILAAFCWFVAMILQSTKENLEDLESLKETDKDEQLQLAIEDGL